MVTTDVKRHQCGVPLMVTTDVKRHQCGVPLVVTTDVKRHQLLTISDDLVRPLMKSDDA